MKTTATRAVTVLAAAAAAAGIVAAPTATAAEPVSSVKPYDFNGDGRVDVAVGIPRWDVFDDAAAMRRADVGAVTVLWGGRDRVEESFITLPARDALDRPRYATHFGWALASADFDQDGFADLAVGAPRDDRSTDPLDPAMGRVYVYYGSATGLGARQATIAHGGHRGFGSSLAAADFTGDGWPDLAVGSPFSPVSGAATGFATGAVTVLRGGPAGFVRASSHDLARPSTAASHFGEVLAAGDVDGDGDVDLVEGAAGDYERYPADALVPGHTTWAPGAPGTGPTAATFVGGRPGASLAVGDVSGDGRADIVVGSPVSKRYRPGSPMPAGRVTFFRGGPAGPEVPGVSVTQDAALVPGVERTGDRFGASVELTDLDRDGRLDVLVGTPGKTNGAGRLVVLRGARTGFAARDNITLDQASGGIPGTPERGDRFAAAVSALDVSGDGRDDLVIGAPGEDGRKGTVTVIRLKGIFYVPSGVASYSLESLQRPNGGPYRQFGTVLGG